MRLPKARKGRAYECECSEPDCGFVGDSSHFMRTVFDGGERRCRKCNKAILEERRERIKEAYSFYYLVPDPLDNVQRDEWRGRDGTSRRTRLKRKAQARLSAVPQRGVLAAGFEEVLAGGLGDVAENGSCEGDS